MIKRSKGYKMRGLVSDFCGAIGGYSREAYGTEKFKCVSPQKDANVAVTDTTNFRI